MATIDGNPTVASPCSEPMTAMELVRLALRGEIDHDELVEKLKGWSYEPQYKVKGEWDDWQSIDNSFDAVELAYVSELISDADYDAIVDAVG